VASAPRAAARLLSVRQRLLLTAAASLAILTAAASPTVLAVAFIAAATLIYLAVGTLRTYLIATAWHAGGAPAAHAGGLSDSALPRYTILVPLYREANVLDTLAAHLARLDYPQDKLEVLLLCEIDDTETIDAVERRRLGPPFELVVCPEGEPRTKPRACNIGLDRARGELCVIYDAEDRPDLDQVRRSAEVFQVAGAEVMCLQARLDYHNRDHNWLTRLFTIEYNFWFDLLLPALVRRDLPIPLGGTSNHFRTAQLRALGGWDAYNVTEDADLGMRLYTSGGRTRMLDSVTLEEACAEVRPWIRQRTRWLKGYLQTWIAHSRASAQLYRRGGWRALSAMHLLIGGAPIATVLNPLFWMLTIYFLLTRAEWVLALFPSPLLWLAVLAFTIGNWLFIYVGFLAVAQRERWELGRAVMVMPLYWLLMSVAGWRALRQLVTGLHVWEKTPHGLSGGDTDPARAIAGLPGASDRPAAG
jgi:glycosyltransferase XagB